MDYNKELVKDFWNEASCGENLYLQGFSKEDYKLHSKKRYELEPEIIDFAQFKKFKNKKILGIGVGLGADHQNFAEHGAILSGIDITPRAINHTKRRFELMGLNSNLQIADAENLPFDNNSFDAVYSWGVLHHSPDTQKAVNEVYRVLKSGGLAKIMIYNKYSLIGYMLWARYALLKLKPFKSLNAIYSDHLESPGTKAYTYDEAKILFSKFDIDSMDSPLTHADLLTSEVGQRHQGRYLSIAKKIWPRWFFKAFMKRSGLFLLVTLTKKS
jgi:ubiquinone/menaquinone biosynthesis C-methylase UbiE